MKILNAQQLKAADKFTIINEPISSVDLMNRAGKALFNKIIQKFPEINSFVIFCGYGNNGGDGLVIARLLKESGKNVSVIILKGNYSEEFNLNFQKIKEIGIEGIEIENQKQIKELSFINDSIFIDGLFGIGISRPVKGLAALLIQKINSFPNFKIAVDVPSGLSPDASFESTTENTIAANYTFTIQLPKFSFLLSENEKFVGRFECIDIKLSEKFITEEPSALNYIDKSFISETIKSRPDFAHKGSFGHALIIAGSEGKTGAAILSSMSALRTGCGLLTALIPNNAVAPLLANLPEAMIIEREKKKFKKIDLNKFQSIGIGPGMGINYESAEMLLHLLKNYSGPIVIDADAITILSQNKKWHKLLSPKIILTPHPGEFDRLTKKHTSGKERFETQLNFSKKYNVNVLLKGHHTSITIGEGEAYFNSTGNNGMATAGSGDVLTGIITSLCSQGYSVKPATILGVYLHGYAGDLAAQKKSKTSMIACDIIDSIADFFLAFEK